MSRWTDFGLALAVPLSFFAGIMAGVWLFIPATNTAWIAEFPLAIGGLILGAAGNIYADPSKRRQRVLARIAIGVGIILPWVVPVIYALS